MKRPSRPYLLLLPLLAVLLFGNCGLLLKATSPRTAYELLGDDFQPEQMTQLRATLQLAQQRRQEAYEQHTTQPAACRAALERIEATIQAQLVLFMTKPQRRSFRRHRATIERRLGIIPAQAKLRVVSGN